MRIYRGEREINNGLELGVISVGVRHLNQKIVMQYSVGHLSEKFDGGIVLV